MTDAEKAAIKERLAAWKRAEPVLQQVRDEDIRTANTASSLRAFTGLLTREVSMRSARADSGLIEQQRWFGRLRLSMP